MATSTQSSLSSYGGLLVGIADRMGARGEQAALRPSDVSIVAAETRDPPVFIRKKQGEQIMKLRASGRGKGIVNRELLMQQKACAACGQALTLGEPVVLACGAWAGPPQWIHEKEAVYDREASVYVEKKCFDSR
jgi:hypothetical protein